MPENSYISFKSEATIENFLKEKLNKSLVHLGTSFVTEDDGKWEE